MRNEIFNFQSHVTRYEDAVLCENLIEQNVILNELLRKAKNDPYILGRILGRGDLFNNYQFENQIADVLIQYSALEDYEYIDAYIDILQGRMDGNRESNLLECVEDFLCEKIVNLSQSGNLKGANECARMIIEKILEPNGRIEKIKQLTNQLQ